MSREIGTFCYNEILMVLKKSVILFFLFSCLLGGLFTFSKLNAQELTSQQRAQLEAELAQTQKEIEEQEKIIADLKQKQKTIGGDITILTAQIKQAEAVLKQKNSAIKKLSTEISAKTQRINSLSARIDRGKISLAELIRRTNEIDTYSLPEAVLSNDNFSEFFGDLDSFNSIQRNLQDLFFAIREAKTETEKEKKTLNEKKNQEEDAKYIIEQKRKEVARNEAEKKQLLAVVNKTKAVQDTILAQKQSRAEQIRVALFGLRDAEAIPFATALEYAETASRATGVRPALILAILTQETNLGKNIGSCYVKNLQTGEGAGKNTGRIFEQVMYSRTDNPNRPNDTIPFEAITSRLGKSWSITPVSCPIDPYGDGKYYVGRGFGGGMGPSQFIPSTWESFKKRIAKVFGVDADQANPWNAQHAITATAIYLADLGASTGTYTNERTAACKYYSGRTCYSSSGGANAGLTYGNEVLKKAEVIQVNIDFLKSV